MGFLFLTWLVLLVTITACGGASRYIESNDDVRKALERYGRLAQARLESTPFREHRKRRHGRRHLRRTRGASAPDATRPRLKKGESGMATLQRWFVEGKISLEQYEREVERLGGSRA